MKTRFFLAATVVALLPAAAPAQQTGRTPSVAVAYDDLALFTQAGRRSLESRIGGAVKRVCGELLTSSVRGAAEYRRCLRDKRAEAFTQARLAIVRAGAESTPETTLAGR